MKPNPESNSDTRVVGIGASAGGLPALEEFFRSVPKESGLAYLVVQHLDPTKKALLPELLQRVTDMTVREASHNASIDPNCVYVLPPNWELSVHSRKLQLSHSTEVRGLRLPIDVLFSSLASEYGERAIAVVLSGMGSDGTLGMQAVKSSGGLTLAQTPDSAQYDSMPQSAIGTGCIDIVAPCDSLPIRIMGLLHGPPKPAEGAVEQEQNDIEAMSAIVQHLRAHTRHDFSLYKTSTLLRRIERRISVHGLKGMSSYATFLETNPKEIELLFKELLIGVTNFFRDPNVWDHLQDSILPSVAGEFSASHKYRAWCAGCSTGEEAYSLAMVLAEVFDRLPPNKRVEVQIFASDIGTDAIAFARRGKYPLSIAEHVSPSRLSRFFILRDGYYFVSQRIRDMVLFAQHDLVLDPPFTKLDLVVCRNLLIYFDSVLQQRLLPLFHYSLRPGGLMLLGSSETIGNTEHLFAAVHAKLRFYQRRNSDPLLNTDLLLNTFPTIQVPNRDYSVSKPTPDNSNSLQNLQSAADHVLLQVYAPAAVVVNGESDIVYISGRTGKYLEPAAGKANWNIHAMVRDGLRAPLYNALKKAATQDRAVELLGLPVEMGNSASLVVDVTVQKLKEPSALRGMFMIVFRDAGVLSERQQSTLMEVDNVSGALATELHRQQEENQRLREENRASQEELQSSNEELQSINEELQSTNEELTTSKEEMQSMNEELQTINSELQAKLDDLALAQSDMQNLLNSTEIAILFLDGNLNVRRYTERAAKIISLRESDVGRPLSDLSSILNYPELNEDAAETLRTLAFSQKQISGSDGRQFSVRIMPYKRLDNVIDGVVITLMAINT
ncbi:chemotaxis protein CheB [Limnobacter parvus]|uniref:PAS domain-containing protein n=1 Tax=Limnobacter parvus TaxID=2939690 RepID=A0ABT1XH25_9BURK|nr:chemotaxis protein CheB [Limnobacter parvus]MCR2746580.1 PAS domain-containing protein [Limnobacter parvus]